MGGRGANWASRLSRLRQQRSEEEAAEKLEGRRARRWLAAPLIKGSMAGGGRKWADGGVRATERLGRGDEAGLRGGSGSSTSAAAAARCAALRCSYPVNGTLSLCYPTTSLGEAPRFSGLACCSCRGQSGGGPSTGPSTSEVRVGTAGPCQCPGVTPHAQLAAQ